mgnify:FL=1
MAEFLDRNNQLRRIEVSPSYVNGWVKLTIETPAKQNSGMTWEMPLKALDELLTNITNIKED